MNRLQINLEGVSGYSAAKRFSDDRVWINLGRDGSYDGANVATIELREYEVYIIGGNDLFARVSECKAGDTWDGKKLFTIGIEIVVDYLKEHPDALMMLLDNVDRAAFGRGVCHAQAKIRTALGISPPSTDGPLSDDDYEE